MPGINLPLLVATMSWLRPVGLPIPCFLKRTRLAGHGRQYLAELAWRFPWGPVMVATNLSFRGRRLHHSSNHGGWPGWGHGLYGPVSGVNPRGRMCHALVLGHQRFALAAGHTNTACVTADGTLWTLGGNILAQLGKWGTRSCLADRSAGDGRGGAVGQPEVSKSLF